MPDGRRPTPGGWSRGRGGLSRERFWIPAHLAFELALVSCLVALWTMPSVRTPLLVGLASHVLMRLWSAVDFISQGAGLRAGRAGLHPAPRWRGSGSPAGPARVRVASALARGPPASASLALPGPHAIGHPLVEVRRAHDRLDAPEPHPLADWVAHTGERDTDAAALRLLDEVQERVTGSGVDEVHRTSVQQHLLRRRVGRRQRGSQPVVEVADARKEQI